MPRELTSGDVRLQSLATVDLVVARNPIEGNIYELGVNYVCQATAKLDSH